MSGDEPVYDDRGNVRPRGTEGAEPRSYEERVAIARRIQNEGPAQAEPVEVKTGRRAK